MDWISWEVNKLKNVKNQEKAIMTCIDMQEGGRRVCEQGEGYKSHWKFYVWKVWDINEIRAEMLKLGETITAETHVT